jgi:anthranilate phosphoribosyltransferase
MDEANIATLHAPLFHPANEKCIRFVRNSGVKKHSFQYARPMVNPSTQNQLVEFSVLSWQECTVIASKYRHQLCAFFHGLDGFGCSHSTDETK